MRAVPRRVALAVAVCYLLPVGWLFLTALKRRSDAVAIPPRLFFMPSVSHLRGVFLEKGFLEAMLNSLAVGLVSAVVAVVLGTLAAYGLRAVRPTTRNLWLFTSLTTRMVPPVAMVVPVYLLFQEVHLLDSRSGLILMHTLVNLGFAVWLMSSYLGEISTRIEEIARLDGLGPIATLVRIVVPLASPGILVTGVFSFLFSWNEFVFASILSAFEARTYPVGVPGLVSHYGTYWEEVAAVGSVASLPALALALIGSRHLVRGLSLGSVYGTR